MQHPEQKNTSPQPCDALVIGGGPAGSCAATLLAQKGWRVVMLEKAVHPRFHIGESLLPLNMPILERLGVLEKVREVGFLKLGADFPADDGSFNVFDFGRTLRESPTTNSVPTGLPSRPSRPISTARSTTIFSVSNGTRVSNCRKSRPVKRFRCSSRLITLNESIVSASKPL